MTLRRRALILMLSATTAICAPVPRGDYDRVIGWQAAEAMPPAIPVAIGAAAAIGATAATAAALTTLATILTVVSVVAGLVGQFLMQPNSPSQQSGLRLQEESSHPTFRYRFGEFRTQGQLVFRHVRGRVMYMTVLINAAPSDSISKIYINETVALELSSAEDQAALYDMTSAGAVPQEPWADPSGSVQQLHLWVGLGDQTQFPQKFINEISGKFPDLATASWQGCTVLHAWCEYGAADLAQKRWWMGAPKFEFLGKWTKVYDPRKDTSLGVSGWIGDHRADDPDTWEWSANPALIALFCLRDPKILGRRDEQLLIDMIAEAADDCDEAFTESESATVYDFNPETSGAPDAPPTPSDLGTVSGMAAVAAGSGEDYALVTSPGNNTALVTTGTTYDFVGASQTWRLTISSKSYDGDNDRTTYRVTPRNTAFSAQSITIREILSSAAASVPEGAMTAISGDQDYVAVTQYTGTIGSVPVLRLKGTFPDLSVAGFHVDLSARGFDPDVGINITVDLLGAGTVGNTYKRLRFYQADKAASGVGDPTAADYAMPHDATNITLLHDEGLSTFGGAVPNPFPGGGLNVTSRYLSMLVDGGPTSGTAYAEWNDFKIIASQTASTRYRCDGVLEVNVRDFSLLDDILGSMGGHLDTSAGKIGVRAGVWKAPVKTLPVPIGESFEVVDRSDPGFDEMVAVYIARAQEYTRTETSAYIIGNANSRRQELPLSMVREEGQAERLASISSERARKNRTLTAVYSGREWDIRVGDRVTTELDFWPDADGTWFVQAERPLISAVEDGFLVRKELTLTEDDEATYAWNAEGFTGKPVAEPVTPRPIDQAPPTDLQALSDVTTSREVVDGGTGSTLRVPRILAYWTAATDAPELYEVQIDPGTGWQLWGYVAPDQVMAISAAERVFAYIEPVTVGVAYDIRVRSVDTSTSIWIEIEDVLVQALPTDLLAPAFTSESYDEPTETRTLTVTMPDSADARQLRVYVSDTELGARSLLLSVYTGPNTAATFTDTQAYTGFTRWYHAFALDAVGTEGPEATQSYTASGSMARAFSTAFSRAFD